MKKSKLIPKLHELLNYELTGALRYLYFSFMIFGVRRHPIVEFFRKEAEESIGHATSLGEKITALGGTPAVAITEVLNSKKDLEDILRESLEHEKSAVKKYSDLLQDVKDDPVLDAFVRDFVSEEQSHVEELEKMLRES